MCLAAFPMLVLLVWWFRNESAKTYRKVRESAALVIVQFVETMTGIKAVQAYRRERRNQEIFEDVADRYTDVNERAVQAARRSSCRASGWSATSPPALVLLYGGYRVLHGEMTIGTLTAFLLYLRMFFEPMQEISQFFNTFQSAAVGAGEARRRARGAARDRGPRASGRAAEREAATSPSTTCSSPTCPDGRCCPTSTSRPGGPDRGAGRHHRRRQDDDRQADRPLLRPDLGVGDPRRRRPARPRRRATCAGTW